MSDTLPAAEATAAPADPDRPAHRARRALLKRLADVVSLPSSRVNPFERAVTADLLVEMLREADVDERSRVARRLSSLSEIPSALVRILLRDDVEISTPILTDTIGLHDADLLDCIRHASGGHRRLIALRKGVSDIVAEALVEAGETPVLEALLRNEQARLSHTAVEMLVAMTQDRPLLAPLLLRRRELRPSHAYVLFWWVEADARRAILQRFAVSREVMQDATTDVFPMAAEEGWDDPLARKALQFIERRQRNRAAVDKSPYASLEDAAAAAEAGITREIAEELSYLSGIKPMTGAKILGDAGGEPLAVLCKATGLPKSALRQLWRGLGRPETTESGEPLPAFERTLGVYETIAVDRAQTVLRYWNWALSSGMTAALAQAIQDDDESQLDEFSVPQRAAMLAFGAELRR